MEAGRLKQIEEIYHAALEIPVGERESFFKESCGADIDLRREVESLLAFDETSDNFIETLPESVAAEMFAAQENSAIIGKQINQFKILSLLGKGGMGEVYLAEDTKLERRIAVKFLSDRFVHDADKLNRFRREAKAASALNHPNILTVYEIGETNGAHYIATEFIDGQVLHRHISKEKLSLEAILDISIQIVSALRTAHEAGIVHRDIKPDNLMIRKDGIIKVLDFGLAKLSGIGIGNLGLLNNDSVTLQQSANPNTKQTSPGMIMGTPNYMSPEQAKGVSITHQTDIFSFGIVLYEMLSGKLPFEGDSAMEVIGAILYKEPIPLEKVSPNLPRDIEFIVKKTLCKNTAERYQNTKDLLTDLRRVKQKLDYEEAGRSFPPEKFKENSETEISDSAKLNVLENAPPNNLSSVIFPLVGRRSESAEIMNLLRLPDVRLLTVTGVGGTGKTRLADKIAHELLTEFADGVFYVRLSTIDNHELVLPVIGQTLGVREESGKPLSESLREHLRGKKILLVLDNFEQITKAAPTLKELLSVSPDLKILVTSRVRLNLELEREFKLQPLGVPTNEKRLTAQEFGKFPAVELFVKRAKAAKFDFALTEENATSIAEICRRLDGLPLAIELAAVRVKLFAPAAILKRLENSLNLLTGGAKDLPERQQTMRGAIAWSYELLDADEQKLFNRLAVFRGGLTLEGAEAVGSAEADLTVDLLDVVSSLVDKSLISQREQADGEPRFRMLVVVREFALDKLAKSGEADVIKRQHAMFYKDFAEKAKPHLQSLNAGELFEAFEREHDNTRAALRWSLDNEPNIALQIVIRNYTFWQRRGYFAEGCQWMMEALEKGGETADPILRAETNRKLAYLFRHQGSLKEANFYGEEGLRLCRQVGDKESISIALGILGAVKASLGEYKSARTLLNESLSIARELDNQRQIGHMLNSLGEIARAEADYEAARKYYEESRLIAKQQNTNESHYPAFNLACVTYQSGDYKASRIYALETLEISVEFGDKLVIALAIGALAALAVTEGKPEKAARLSGASDAICESINFKSGKLDQNFIDLYNREAREAIGDEAFDAAYAKGRAMDSESAITLAREGEFGSANETNLSHEVKSEPKTYATDESLKTQTLIISSVNPTIPDISRLNTFSLANRRKGVLVAILIIILLATIGFFGYRYLTANREIKSIAVMPFVNEGGNSDAEYLSDGMTETLIAGLSQLPNLRVKARSSVFRYKGKDTDEQTIGRELNVQAILNGRIIQRGDQLILRLELVDASTEDVIWVQQYIRKQVDLVSLQSEIARDVSEKLQPKISGAEAANVAKTATTDPEAYQAYLKGRYYWNRRTTENIQKAIEQFKYAADRDPNYALAYAGLADCYAVLRDYAAVPSSETIPQVKIYAERALSLDPQLAEPHASLARINENLHQWAEAEKEFQRAIELNPNYATAYHWYSILLRDLGRFDESLAMIKKAHELDPLSSVIGINVSQAYQAQKNYDASIENTLKVIELDPSFSGAYNNLALSYIKTGRETEAVANLEKAVELSKRADVVLRNLGYAYGVVGRRAEAIAIAKELEGKYAKKQAIGQFIAAVYAGLGDKDKVFEWLEKDFQNNEDLAGIRWSPQFEIILGDPRYKDLLKRMGLPE